jgi:hypothetical protein
MESAVADWLECDAMKRCNVRHKAAIMPTIMYLVNICCGYDDCFLMCWQQAFCMASLENVPVLLISGGFVQNCRKGVALCERPTNGEDVMSYV